MRPRKAPVAALLCALAAAAAGAADPGRQEIQVIRAETAFTGREFVGEVYIVVADGRILEVVPAGEWKPIEGSRLIDAAGLTVTPGLIDSHVHLFGLPPEATGDIARRGWGRVAEQMVSLVPGNREQYLRAGVTGLIDMGSTVEGIRRIAGGLESGKLLGPDLYWCGPLFTAPGGHPAGTIYRGQHDLIDHATVQVDRPGPAAARVAQLAGRGVSFIKLVYDDGTSYGGKVPRLALELAARIAAEAHARGLPVIAHVGAVESGFADMLAAGADGVEHCFPYAGSDAVFREAAARGVFFTPTLSIYELYARPLLPRMKESVARARALGVPIAAGTDFPTTPFPTAGAGLFRELELLEEAGLSRREVLEAATWNGARKIGREGEAGLLAAGRAANLAFFEGDLSEGPLDAGRVRAVMLHGRMVVEGGAVAEESRRGLRRRPLMVFPYGFYDEPSGFSLGLSLLDFNLLGTGAAVGLNAAFSFQGHPGGELTVSSPSPLPRTSLDFRLAWDGYPKRYFGEEVIRYEWRSLQGAVSTSTALAPHLALNASFAVERALIEPFQGRGLPELTADGGGFTTLARAQLALDHRDAAAAPWSGSFAALGAGLSHPWLGSGFTYAPLDLDLRWFLSVARHHVLATRLLFAACLGDAPFYSRPDFGGFTLGRGFPADRFSGDYGVYGQLEYRFPVWALIGGVLFLDAGQVGDDPGRFTAGGFHLGGGAGLRFTFAERSILAFDFGFNGEPPGGEGFAFVVRSGHAF